VQRSRFPNLRHAAEGLRAEALRPETPGLRRRQRLRRGAALGQASAAARHVTAPRCQAVGTCRRVTPKLVSGASWLAAALFFRGGQKVTALTGCSPDKSRPSASPSNEGLYKISGRACRRTTVRTGCMALARAG